MADRYLLESGSPDGYLLEDGTGVLSLEIYGPELVLNGNFSSGTTSWNPSPDATATGPVLVVTSGSNFIYQNVGFVAGHTYRVTLNYTSTSGANLRIGNGPRDGTLTAGTAQAVTTDGATHSLSWSFVALGVNLSIEADGALFTGTIDDVSANEDLSTTTHATTGALTGPGSTIVGAAVYNAKHTTTGALTGPGSTIAGTAAHIAIHTSTGVLTGLGSTVVGSAARTREHATSGILTGPGSVIVGVAVYNAKHATSGAITGAGSVIVGAAARTREHATTGVLTGPGSTIAGTAVYNAKHTTSGTLTGSGSTVVGSAARFRAFATSGVLVGPGSTIAGVAARSGIVVTVHATSGVLVGQPSIIDGTAARTRQHATSGILTGPPALVVGVNTRWRDHDSSGVLLGVTGVVFGRGFNGTPQLHDIPVDSDNLTDEPASPAANLGPISEPSGQIVNHPPYPPA